MAKASKALGALGDWILDKVIEKWPWIVTAGAGLAMSWAAAVSDWLARYGPVAWGGVGILTMAALALIYWLWSAATRSRAVTKLAEDRERALTVNPLAGSFARMRLKLADFFDPFYQPTTAAKFTDCQLHGPAMVYLQGCTLLNCVYTECQFVIVSPTTKRIIGATAFVHCTFERSKFIAATFLMSKSEFLNIKGHLPSLPDDVVIADGSGGGQ